MNNSQFRDLVKSDKTKSTSARNGGSSALVPRSLGSRARSSVPMTPRTVAGHSSSKDLARQVAEHTRQSNGEPALKKFKSSAAPKGTRLAEGYQDRARLREGGYNEETSREKKLNDLEKMLKEEKIDQATFTRLREQMGIGGDLRTTHLVKGLDFKLLGKMRRGEDVDTEPPHEEAEPGEPPPEVDDELDYVLDKDVEARQKDQTEAEPEHPEVETQSISRDEILRRLKEGRNAIAVLASAPEVSLGDKFKKVAASEKQGKKKYVETVNGRRREVLIITKKDGSTKRKTRWIDPECTSNNENAAPLGMEVPAEFAAKQKALLEQQAIDDENDDIFVDVADYDPLQGLDSGSDDSDPGEVTKKKVESAPVAKEAGGRARNYFSIRDDAAPDEAKFSSIKNNPNLMAALKRAAALRKGEEEGQESQETESAPTDPDQAERHKKFLARLKQQEREDNQDVDLGFGESRFGDDDEDGPIYDGEEERDEKSKRKRGPRKRKGDKDSVADVMGVLEGRKK